MSPEEQNEFERLLKENGELRRKYASANQYIRSKVNQLLTVMGTSPLRPEELDDETLIELDPISIISGSFVQILRHLNETNAQLRKSEERYRDLFENSSDLIQIVSADSTILYVNRAWKEALHYGEGEIAGLSIFDIIHPECNDCGAEFKSVVCGAKDGRFETMFITRTGEKIIVEGNVSTVVEDGRFVGTRGIFRDITERKKAEAAIAAEREQLAVTLRSIGDGVVTTDTSGRIVLINRVAERLTGWRQSEAIGRQIAEVFDIVDETTGAACESPVERVLHIGAAVELSGNVMLKSRDGARRIISNSVAPILNINSVITGTVLVFRDITERRRLEERLLKSEKIESLGILAGGIAHDFNNLLNAIMGNIDIALSFADVDGEIHRSLECAEKATARASDLTKQLLTFSKGGVPVKKVAAISDLVRDTADFVTRGSNARCEFTMSDEIWKAEVDEGQISQVINNLVINAIQSMSQGGTIHISAENASVTTSGYPELTAGSYVKITVRDEGEGIPKENLHRIFEPYFTTKETGCGLGLATTYSIVRNHGGMIDVESLVGRGTAFHIYLPAACGDVLPQAEPALRGPSKERKGRVLVLDDDDLIRKTAGRMLDLMGYEVVCAAEGNAALEMFREANRAGKPFDAVIMDLTIPGGIGGKEAVKQVLEIDPHAKVIVSSGYSSDAIMANYRQYGFSGVLAKPYRRKDLGDVLDSVIGSTGKI